MAEAEAPTALETLDALRQQGADRREPLRWLALQALARRRTAQAGALRGLLDARLALLLADLQQRLAAAPAAPAAPGDVDQPGRLGQLLRDALPAAPPAAAPELRTVRAFSGSWARLRLDQQLRRARQQQPDNAGPLHSQRVLLQALQQLRGLSPAYLQHLLAQADALLWLDDHAAAAAGAAPAGSGGNAGPAAATTAGAAPRKRRSAPRPRP